MRRSLHKDNDTVPLKQAHDQDNCSYNVLYCKIDLQPVNKISLKTRPGRCVSIMGKQ
jgi:hypothetical protein